MPQYEISVQCSDCGHEHQALIKIHLDHGPVHKQSVAESFQGRSMPPQVMALKTLWALCRRTGKRFYLENDEKVFLVPPSAFERNSHNA
jgi:hypothetical protein